MSGFTKPTPLNSEEVTELKARTDLKSLCELNWVLKDDCKNHILNTYGVECCKPVISHNLKGVTNGNHMNFKCKCDNFKISCSLRRKIWVVDEKTSDLNHYSPTAISAITQVSYRKECTFTRQATKVLLIFEIKYV